MASFILQSIEMIPLIHSTPAVIWHVMNINWSNHSSLMNATTKWNEADYGKITFPTLVLLLKIHTTVSIKVYQSRYTGIYLDTYRYNFVVLFDKNFGPKVIFSELQWAQGKDLPREKFYPEKKPTLEEVYPGKNPQFLSNLYETWWKYSWVL